MENTIGITSGPSREELFDGLRLFAEKRELGFNLKDNGREMTLPFVIRSIEAKDGSGNSWSIKMVLHLESLKINFNTLPFFLRKAFFGNPIKSYIIVETYYSTRTRKGVITIE